MLASIWKGRAGSYRFYALLARRALDAGGQWIAKRLNGKPAISNSSKQRHFMHPVVQCIAVIGTLPFVTLDASAVEICGLQRAVYDGIFVDGFSKPASTGLGPAYTTVVAPETGIAPTVAITFPAHGSTIDRRTQIAGTVSGPSNVGVVVNGERAYVTDGKFVTRSLTLDAATTRLSVTATAPDGLSASASSSVTVSAVEPDAILEADAEAGFAPLPVRFSVRLRTGRVHAIRNVRIDYSTDGIPDYDGTGPIPRTTFETPGVYTATATLTLSDGSHRSASRQVVALDLIEQRRNVCSVYANLRARLAAQDASGAARSLHGPIRDKLFSLFTALGTQMPTVGASLGTLADGVLGLDGADIVAVREIAGVVKGYPVHFTRDANGVWRIDAM